MPPDRNALLTGAHNFRDLGGYHTSDGRRVRTGLVFRSNSLQELTAVDLEIVREPVVLASAATHHPRDTLGDFLRRRPSYAHTLNRIPSDALDSEPETMREFLRQVEVRYGGPRDWVLGAGLDAAVLTRLEATL